MNSNMQTTHDRVDTPSLTGETPRPRKPAVYYCRRSIYRNGTIQQATVPESKIHRRSYEGFNLYLDLVHQDIGVRMPNGKVYEPEKDLIGIKGQPLSTLLKLMQRPGVYHSSHDIGNMPPYRDSHFISENIAQYVARLRRNLFREGKDNERFILTLRAPYRVAFNDKLSFCLIEPWRDEEAGSNKGA